MEESNFFQIVKNNFNASINGDGKGFGVLVDGLDSTSEILKISLKEFPARFNFLRIGEIDIDWGHDIQTIWVDRETEPQIKVYSHPELDKWKNIYSFEEYFKQIEKIIDEEYDGLIEISENDWSEGLFQGVEISVKNISLDVPVIDEIHRALATLRRIHFQSAQNLSKNDKNSVTTLFNFPESIKFSCEQYLLYFARFLEDLGIDAKSSIKEEAEKVLFSVTPTDDIEALDRIREALAVYLNLPSSPIVYDESFAAMRLQQQVENLQHSQKMAVREIRSAERELRLAQTVIESQDKIIFQKDTLIEQQTKVIDKITSKSIMMDSLENKEEFEKIFDGLEVGESKILKEQIGIRFNPVTSLKTLGKKVIGKGDEITSLNLNEETNQENN